MQSDDHQCDCRTNPDLRISNNIRLPDICFSSGRTRHYGCRVARQTVGIAARLEIARASCQQVFETSLERPRTCGGWNPTETLQSLFWHLSWKTSFQKVGCRHGCHGCRRSPTGISPCQGSDSCGCCRRRWSWRRSCRGSISGRSVQ